MPRFSSSSEPQDPQEAHQEAHKAKIATAMEVFRTRFRASMNNTCNALRALSTQLETTPTATAVLDTVRRELHRIHGSGGTFGYIHTSRLARAMEHRAVAWASDPTLDTNIRGALLRRFMDDLDQALHKDDSGSEEDGLAGGANAPAGSQAAEGASGETLPGATTPGAPSPSQATGHEQSSEPAAVQGSDLPNVIVVEDDRALSDMLRYALESHGFTVHTFITGPDALENLLHRSLEGPTLVLLDVDLPGIDGHSIHERLRVQRPGAYAIVFISARASESEQLRAFKAGAIDYVVKPTSLRVLLAKVPIWLSMVRHAR